MKSVAPALLALAVSASPENPGSASGTFEDETWKLEIAGAYAFWDESAMGDDPVIQVAVSNTGFRSEAVDEHYDKRHAINSLFADEESKVVYFELDASGKYHGLSYYFGPGSGCGYCFDSKVQSTVRPQGGRLRGELSYQSDDRRFRVSIDVPIPSKSWGDPLPKDGGAPGKVFLAYSAALEKRDSKAIAALCDAEVKARLSKFEKEGQLDGYLDYLWKEEHTEINAIRITGGFIRGDRAVVLFDGSNPYIEKLHGEALLRREGGAWLFHEDMVAVGSRGSGL